MLVRSPPNPAIHLKPLLASLGIGGLWFVLAWRSPSSTHHFAPLVLGAAWGFLLDASDRASTRAAAAAGTAVALLTLAGLAVADRLQGPTLWGARPSWPELAGFAVLGGLVTLARAQRRETT